jgi:hypothetical protein
MQFRENSGKLSRRLELTVSRGAWLPRIERLVQLRNLDSFEKNILLTLLGKVLKKQLYQRKFNNGSRKHDFPRDSQIYTRTCL